MPMTPTELSVMERLERLADKIDKLDKSVHDQWEMMYKLRDALPVSRGELRKMIKSEVANSGPTEFKVVPYDR